MADEASADEAGISRKRRVATVIGLPLWVLASFIIASLIITGIDYALRVTGTLPGGILDASVRNAVIAALVYILTLVIAIGVPRKWRDSQTTREDLGLTRLPSWSDILLAPAAFFIYMICAGLLTIAVSGLVPSFDAEQVQEVGFENLSRSYEYVLAFVTLVVLAPVAEEILIRGYLYGKLRKTVSVIAAMLISSLLFALMHFQWNVAVNVFPLAIILVVLRETTGSIWAGILLHMLKNGVAFYFLFVNPSIIGTIVR